MNPWRGLKGLPSTVWLVCGTTLVNRLGTMALPFLLLYLTEARGWSAEQAGMAMMVYGAGGLVSSPVSGRLADRLGHARVLVASLLLSALALLAIPLAASRLLLFPLIALWAALGQAFWPSAMALLVSQAPPEKRKAVYALHRLAVNLGMAVGPALGGLIAHHSFRWVFWGDGLTTLLSGLLLVFFLKVQDNPAPEGGRPGRSPWTDRRLLFLLLAFLPVLVVFFQIEGALPLWVVRDLGHGTRFFGLIFTVNTLIIVGLEVALNLAMARWPHGRQLALGSLFYAAGFGLTAFAFTRGALVATVVVWTFGEMILLPAMSDAVATLAPADRRGEYMGLYALSFAAALALGPWLGVLAYSRLGPAATWGACALLGLGSAGLLSRFRARTADAAPPP
ncbi:MAG: MFS transporter [Acidobacteria bacterium]|nr:MFS transporter [Acidobacteriota bacterium]